MFGLKTKRIEKCKRIVEKTIQTAFDQDFSLSSLQKYFINFVYFDKNNANMAVNNSLARLKELAFAAAHDNGGGSFEVEWNDIRMTYKRYKWIGYSLCKIEAVCFIAYSSGSS